MKATILPASTTALANRAAAGIAHVDPDTAALPEQQRQHCGDQQGRAPERDIPGRQIDAAHDQPAGAENGCGANGADDAHRGGTLRRDLRFHDRRNCEYGVRRAPVHRFPRPAALRATLSLVGRRLADDRGLLAASGSDLSPHTSERVCFPMADRTGDILLGMLDRPAEPEPSRPLVDPGSRPYRLRGQLPHPERRAPSAGSRLSRAAPERARRGAVACLLRRALPCRPHRGFPPRAVDSCPRN